VVIGELTGLGEAVDTFPDCKVHPTIRLVKVVLGDELLWDFGQLDADIFVAVEGTIKIQVFNVKDCKFCSAAQQDAIKEELDELKGPYGCADITREANVVATNGDAGLVGVVCAGLDFACHAGVIDFLAAVGRDVGVVDGKESIRAFGPAGRYRSGLYQHFGIGGRVHWCTRCSRCPFIGGACPVGGSPEIGWNHP